MLEQTYSPKEIAEKWGISVRKVIGWINSGQLAAFDVSTRRGKPRWRITESAIAAFITARQGPVGVPIVRRRRLPPLRERLV